MRPFVPVENRTFPSCGKTENTISSRERHTVFTTPSGRISRTALWALASLPPRRVCDLGVSEDTESSGSMTWMSCGPAALTVTVTEDCWLPEVVAGVDGAAGGTTGSPVIAEA